MTKRIIAALATVCAASATFARGVVPEQGGGQSIGAIMKNLALEAVRFGDMIPDVMYAMGSVAVLVAGYNAFQYSKKNRGDPKGLASICLPMLAALFCFYAPTFLDVGASSAMNGARVEGIKIDSPSGFGR